MGKKPNKAMRILDVAGAPLAEYGESAVDRRMRGALHIGVTVVSSAIAIGVAVNSGSSEGNPSPNPGQTSENSSFEDTSVRDQMKKDYQAEQFLKENPESGPADLPGAPVKQVVIAPR